MTLRRSISFIAIAATVFLLALPSGALRATTNRKSIVVDGTTRTCTLHVPPASASAKPMPLVLALHGRLGTGAGQERLSHLDKLADEHGFLLAYPMDSTVAGPTALAARPPTKMVWAT